MNEFAIRKLYSLLGHTGYWSRVGSLDCSSKQYEDVRLFGIDAILEYARKWNGQRNIFISRNFRDQSGVVLGSRVCSIDVDPLKDPGAAANDEQHNTALTVGQSILELYGNGHLCSSGNGALLLFPCHIERDGLDAYYKKEKEFLKQLQGKYPEVKIDETSYSQAVVKLIGTQSTKGEQRYHRLSRFITSSTNNSGRLSIADAIQAIQVNSVEASTEKFNGDPVKRLKEASETVQKLDVQYVTDYEKWLQVGMTLKEFGMAGLQIWKEWSKKSEKYEEGICEKKWETFKEVPSITLASLKYWAQASPKASNISTSFSHNEYFAGLFSSSNDDGHAITTGIRVLDTCIRSLPKGEITTIAARSGFGKSSFACTVAEYNREHGKKVLVFSTEMDIIHYMHKMVSISCNIPLEQVINKQFSTEEAARIRNYEQRVLQSPLKINADYQPTLELVKMELDDYKPDLIIFDHISHVAHHWEGVAQFMRGFKDLVSQYNIPALALSMLNEPPRGSNGTVGVSVRGDVRGSQEVIFISAIYALINNPFEVKTDYQPVEIEICKNRYGLSGMKLECKVNKKTGLFHD